MNKIINGVFTPAIDLIRKKKLLELFTEQFQAKSGRCDPDVDLDEDEIGMLMDENEFSALSDCKIGKYSIGKKWQTDFSFEGLLIWKILTLIGEAGFDLSEVQIIIPKKHLPLRIHILDINYYFILAPLVEESDKK